MKTVVTPHVFPKPIEWYGRTYILSRPLLSRPSSFPCWKRRAHGFLSITIAATRVKNVESFSVAGSRIVRKYPVLVFIHGESYEWNSGNPYDGRVLASNAELVVVTLNYRLGILGE